MSSGESRTPVDWLKILLKQEQRGALVSELGVVESTRVLEQLLAHVDVHMAEGNRQSARTLLELGRQVAGGETELLYRLERKRIRWLEAEGRQGESIESMRSLYRRYSRSRKHPQRGAELAMELGILLDRSGHKEEALEHFRNAIRRYTRLGHTYNRAAALFNAASVLYDLGRISHSMKTCLRALREGGSGHLDLETHVTLQMANCYESESKSKGPVALARATASAREWYKYAAEGYRRLGNRKQESDILYRLGWMAMRRNESSDATQFLQRALELKREYDYGTGLALYHLHRAEAYRWCGLTKRALSHYRSCLSLASVLGNDGLCTRARFGLYRTSGGESHALSAFLKVPPAAGADSTLARGKDGLYSEQGGDGFRTAAWREGGKPESPAADRTFLARLLEDLSRVWKNTGVNGHEQLRRQGRAVLSWQSKARRQR